MKFSNRTQKYINKYLTEKTHELENVLYKYTDDKNKEDRLNYEIETLYLIKYCVNKYFEKEAK